MNHDQLINLGERVYDTIDKMIEIRGIIEKINEKKEDYSAEGIEHNHLIQDLKKIFKEHDSYDIIEGVVLYAQESIIKNTENNKQKNIDELCGKLEKKIKEDLKIVIGNLNFERCLKDSV